MGSGDRHRSRSALGAKDPGKPQMLMQDATARLRIVMSENGQGMWGIAFVDADGKPIFGVPFGPTAGLR